VAHIRFDDDTSQIHLTFDGEAARQLHTTLGTRPTGDGERTIDPATLATQIEQLDPATVAELHRQLPGSFAGLQLATLLATHSPGDERAFTTALSRLAAQIPAARRREFTDTLTRYYRAVPPGEATPAARTRQQATLTLSYGDPFHLQLADDNGQPARLPRTASRLLTQLAGRLPTPAGHTISAEQVEQLTQPRHLQQLQQAGTVLNVPRALADAHDLDAAVEMTREQQPAVLDTARLATLRPVLVDGEDADPATITQLVGSLARTDDGWVRLTPAAAARAAAAQAAAGELDRNDMLTTALAGELDTDGHTLEVLVDAQIDEQLAQQLTYDPARNPDLDQLDANLHPHQVESASWLQQLTDQGWGVHLGDDMGLGKTLSAITLLAARPGPHLVVAPMSVIGNWQREIERFAPNLTPRLHYGPGRAADPAQIPNGPRDVAITSHETLVRDQELLCELPWGALVVDEAHVARNPVTLTARALRQIPADRRVALTGTALVNRVGDLWSMFEILNPGLLGRQDAFKTTYATPIEERGDQDRLERLNRILAPFTLARAKDDVDLGLPGRTDHVEHVEMTREQAQLYTAATDAALAGGLGEGMERRANILALLTRLKQVSNHPASCPTLEDDGPISGRSGKLMRADELVDIARTDGEKTLVFTQYTEMGRLLCRHYNNRLGQEVELFHGGLSNRARQRVLDRFADPGGPDLLVMQLKAGGVGLNLTDASRVIVYDLWWNWAMENQAICRSHRIGQQRHVNVHRLVSTGTFDEELERIVAERHTLEDALSGNGGMPDFATWSDEVVASLTELRDHPQAA